MLIKMIDGGFTKYWDDAMYYSGCETCDYGSEYIQFIAITLTKYEIEIKLNRMYEYAFSQADAITLFCENYEKISHMKELEFCDFLRDWLVEKYGESVIEKFEVEEL